ncbi:MAG: cell division protein FtsZ [Clostridia bacterium]|nr:cell division protein FtsZ [Clostridia bacterium]
MLEQVQTNITKDLIKIKVLGIGGGGNNAVNQMIKSRISGAEYVLVNTERQILDKANTNGCEILQIGKETAKGLGAGANPEVGERAAIESRADIERILDGTDLVFLTAGMGGGTGTGAIPVIAEIAKKKGILTIGVATTPFTFEGKLRTVRAENGIEKLKNNVNSLIIISNNQLLENTDNNVSILNAFKLTDDILRQAIESITDLIHSVGTINVDFADIKTVLSYEGYSYMGIGEADGENKIEQATESALSNPLTINQIDGAKGVIFNIKGGEDIGLEDINRSAEIISEKIDEDANVIFGTEIDPNLNKKVVVTIVATGINEERKNK